MPFGPVDPTFDLVALEEDILTRWRDRDVIAESRRQRARTCSSRATRSKVGSTGPKGIRSAYVAAGDARIAFRPPWSP